MADPGTTIEVSQVPSLAAIDPAEWDACAVGDARAGRPHDPFTTHRFLSALERSGSVGAGAGWQPCHLIARVGGELVGAMPLYLKSNSQGEYIFDHHWAEAYERAGRRYYPKLQSAVPFTPVTGRRLLVRPDHKTEAEAALIAAAIQLTKERQISSLHITFCTGDECDLGAGLGLLPRLSQQYHWSNDGYADFVGFLAALSSRKRKTIRKERETARGFGGRIHQLTGDQIEPRHWDAFWAFYQDTGSRKWGRPYLTRAFFDELHATMRNDILMVLAERDGRPIAGALNFIGRDTLFGRYWGASEDHPCLHFECCYYQAMDYAIKNRLSRVEAGAQGEHKIARGYLPAATHSLHWIADPGLRRAIERYLIAETAAVGDDMGALAAWGPFRKGQDPG